MTAVGKIRLVPVVLRRIMTCRDHNARRGVQFPYGKREFRRGTERFEKIRFNTVCRENQRGGKREFGRHSAAVVRDDDAAVFFFRVYKIRKPLRRLAHGIYIHSVCSRADHAAKSARTERKLFVKRVLDLLFIGHRRHFFTRIFIEYGIVQPIFILFAIRFHIRISINRSCAAHRINRVCRACSFNFLNFQFSILSILL